MGDLLRNRAFRRLWLGGLLSASGSQVSRIGLLLYVFGENGSAAALALVVALETLPGALLAPVAGAVVDRVSKRAVMVVSDLARAALLGVILLRPSLPVICAVVALHSIASAFFHPSRAAVLPHLVQPPQLPRANGLEESASHFALIVGPVLGAQLLARFGLGPTLVLDMLSFLASAALLAGVPVPAERGGAPPFASRGTAGEIAQGWRYAAGHPFLLRLNGLLFVALLCTGMWVPLAPFFIRDRLGGTDQLFGWQISAFGIGAVLGGAAAARMVARFGKGQVLFGGLVAEGVLVSLYAVVPHAGISTALILVWGLAVPMIMVPAYSILQEVGESRYLGRLFALVRQSEGIALVLAVVIAGLLHGLLDSWMVLLAAGVLYLACTATAALSRSGRILLATR